MKPHDDASSVSNINRWICQLTPHDGELRVFCFPYAGGSPHTFANWRSAFSKRIGIYTVQLPGRGRRLEEPSLDRLVSLASPIAKAIGAMADRPYVLFGHSMGALLAFETARVLRQMGCVKPAQLIASAYGAPQLPRRQPPIHLLDQDAFVSHIREMGGTPAELFRHQELLDLVVPILRTDFAAIENYVYRPAAKLDTPIMALVGKTDAFVSIREMTAWQDQTEAPFSLHVFNGGHFFLHTAEVDLLRLMSAELTARLIAMEPQT